MDADNIVTPVCSNVVHTGEEQEDEEEKESMSRECLPVPTTSESLEHKDNVRHYTQTQNTPQCVPDQLAEEE